MKMLENIVYGTQDPASQVLDVYLPECEEADVLVYFHGGGLEHGDKRPKNGGVSHLNKLTAADKIVISANYRMYPKAVFPEFLEDGAAVVKWAIDHLGDYGKKVKKIFISGSSAGAYMTAMLAFDEKYLGKHGIATTQIDGYIIDSAQMTTHFNVLRERGVDTRRIAVDEAAPIYFVNENTKFPNIYVIVADDDMPCRVEQNHMFLKTLAMFNCPAEKVKYQMMHGYKHTRYTGTDIFLGLVNHYMDTTQA